MWENDRRPPQHKVEPVLEADDDDGCGFPETMRKIAFSTLLHTWPKPSRPSVKPSHWRRRRWLLDWQLAKLPLRCTLAVTAAGCVTHPSSDFRLEIENIGKNNYNLWCSCAAPAKSAQIFSPKECRSSDIEQMFFRPFNSFVYSV